MANHHYISDTQYQHIKLCDWYLKKDIRKCVNELRECMQDVTCLDAWVDSLEYEIKNYISPCGLSAFRGFIRALTHHLLIVQSVLDNPDFFLTL